MGATRPLTLAFFLFATTAAPPSLLAGPASPHPHIILLYVDDIGYGDPACYNPDSKIPTPHIDSLARDGMRFTDAHAAGALCHPSRYGLLTGRYPLRTDVSVWPDQPLIEEGQTTLASLLQSQGYHTVMVGKWHLGFAEDGYHQALPGGPVDRGFDEFFGIRASTDIPPYFYIRGDRATAPPSGTIPASSTQGWSPIQGAFWRAGGIAPDLKLEEVLPRFTGESIAAIRSHAASRPGRPLFLYHALPAPHTPWLPTTPFIGTSQAGLYGDFMAMVDHELGRVLQALEEAGMAGQSLVIFTGDNGPVWYPDDVRRFGHSSVGPLRGMKGDAWEGGHRMPFIVRWPDKIEPGSVSHQLISQTDLLATFADLTDAKLPPGAGEDSFSILPVWLGEQPPNAPIRPSVVISGLGETHSIRSGPWKLIEGLGSRGFSKPTNVKPTPGGPTGQLYHLGDDPAETDNLWLEQPELRDRLLAELHQIIRSGHPRPR
jgi:arylsulfatase A